MFQRAIKKGSRLRLALIGPSGSGKTYSALSIAQELGKKIAYIDTEHGSARKYADVFNFDVVEFESFAVERYLESINAAQAAGYDVLIIDSLSHAWVGKDGLLEFVDMVTERSKSKNKFTSGWREATPLHNRLIDTILAAKMHIIACMRSKTEYVMEEDPRTGKKVPTKIGMQPVQRDGMEYEFDVVGDITLEHKLIISKSRCPDIDGKLFDKPGAEFAKILLEWLGDIDAEEKKEEAQQRVETKVENSRKRLSDLLMDMHKMNLNGYEEYELVRDDIQEFLGVPKLLACDDVEGMDLMHEVLSKIIEDDNRPSAHISPKDYLAYLQSVTEEPGVSEAPENVIDFKATMKEIKAEAKNREIPPGIKRSMVSTAIELAEKKSESIMSILTSIRGYPVKATQEA